MEVRVIYDVSVTKSNTNITLSIRCEEIILTRTSPIIKVLTTRDIKPYYVKVLGLQKIESESITRLINKFRSISSLVRVQAIDSDAIFGMNHLIRVLQITLELWNRRIRISRSLESDLLMR